MTNPFSSTSTHKPGSIIQTIATQKQNPFASSNDDNVEQHAAYVANQMKREEEAILRELRGDRKPFREQMWDAMKEIEREERAEKAREAKLLSARSAYRTNIQRVGKRSERSRLNFYLKSQGYEWQATRIGTEEADLPGGYAAGVGEYSHTRFSLHAPDGRIVSVQQAMREIADALSIE